MVHSENYRPEFDGLRALAVLPVVYFHAGFPGLPGGFLGVDVFFVISGYLITKILLEDLAAQRFSIMTFYERRMRRILPALFVMMAVTWPFAYWLMPIKSFEIFEGSQWATALFVSNAYFLSESGYFQPAAEIQPLLHTWSLAVEEQFYIIFPVLLACGYRFAKSYLFSIVAILAAASFVSCLIQYDSNPDAVFYLSHFRAWELLCGALVAMAIVRNQTEAGRFKKAKEPLAFLGLLLLLSGYILTNSADPLPGVKSLLPVLGTMLVLACAARGTWVARLLSARVLTSVGLISYSLYLWHHPLFSFARLFSIGEPTVGLMILLTGLAVAIAYASWRWVENPWRKPGLRSRNTVFASAIGATLLAVFLSLLSLRFELSRSRIDKEDLAEIFPPMSTAEDCAWETPIDGVSDFRICRIGKANAVSPIVVWGDSHARALRNELHSLMLSRGEGGFYVANNYCVGIPGVIREGLRVSAKEKGCVKTLAHVFDYIASQQPSRILLSMRWTMRLFPVPGSGESVAFDNGEGGKESETARQMVVRDGNGNWSTDPSSKEKAVLSFVRKLGSIAPTIVVGPVPEVGWNVGEVNFKTVYLHGNPKPEINTSYERFRERNGFVLDVLSKASNEPNVSVVWPHLLFCDTEKMGRCVAQTPTVSYYSDDDHLSEVGAKTLLSQVFATSN